MTTMHKRGIVASALVVGALVLILSFRTPESSGLALVSLDPGASGSGSTTISTTYSGQVTGDAIGTPFGTVQVQVTLQNGRITDVQAIQFPNDNGHSYAVSQYATPRLRSEVLAAQSARVDSISGATYTSYAYIQSAQSALDKARA
jgi:uncharacterized protein with FMN-binding domain